MSSEVITLENLSTFKGKCDETYQGKLTAGSNITISEDNVISATGGGTGGSVSTDDTLNGDGTETNPLGVDIDKISDELHYPTETSNFVADDPLRMYVDDEGTVHIADGETLLFSTDTPTNECTLSEPLTNFEFIKIMFSINDNCQVNEFCAHISDHHKNIVCFGNADDSFAWGKQNIKFEENKVTITDAWAFVGLNANTYDANNNIYAKNSIGKIWGVKRKTQV